MDEQYKLDYLNLNMAREENDNELVVTRWLLDDMGMGDEWADGNASPTVDGVRNCGQSANTTVASKMAAAASALFNEKS